MENISLPLSSGLSLGRRLAMFLGISLKEAQGMVISGTDFLDISSFPDRFLGSGDD